MTLKDIALRTGVNISTVSRALNNSSEIGEKTKERIRRVAKQISYIPDITAKALAGKGTKSIGVIVPEISSNYYAMILNCIEQELKLKGYSLIVGMAHHDCRSEQHYLEVFSNRRVDGMILAGSMNKGININLDEIRQKSDIPIVLVHAFIPYRKYDYISVDDIYGIDAAIKLLKSQGHRRLGYIADELSSKFRISKIRNAISLNGLSMEERHIKIGKEMYEVGGYIQMKRLLREKDLPTAILASYDYIAIGAIKAMSENGIHVPKDMSIIGYDNIRESPFLVCPLTTISPPVEEMVKISIQIMHKKIQDKSFREIQHISLKPELSYQKFHLRYSHDW